MLRKNSITVTDRNDVHPEWLADRNPRALEAQEKRGQQEFLESDVLPTDRK